MVEFAYLDTFNYHIYDIGIQENDTITYYRPSDSKFGSRKLNLEDLTRINRDSLKINYWFDTSGKNLKFFTAYGHEQCKGVLSIL